MGFQKLGYFLEYYVSGKFIGTQLLDKADRDEAGYFGRVYSTAVDLIHLQRGKEVKKGVYYYTILYPLCGRTIKNKT